MDDAPVSPERFKALFHARYVELAASGVAPNDAAAQALRDLQHLVPAVAPAPAAAPAAAADHEDTHAEEEEEEGSDPTVPAPVPASATTPPPPAPVDAATPHEQQHAPDVDMEDTDDEAALERAVALSLHRHHHADDEMQAEEIAADEGDENPQQVQEQAHVAVVGRKSDLPPMGVQLQNALHAAAATDEYKDVKRLVYQIFSDLGALNAAFVTDASTMGAIATDKWWHVDHALLSAVYELLGAAMSEAADHVALQNTMRNALETLVSQPWNVCSTWTTPAALRFFLILFEHPSVFDPDYLNVIGGLSKLFYHSSLAAKALVREHWDAHFDNDELYRLLQILQQAITVCLYGSRKLDLVYASCSVLKELHAINDRRSVPFATYEEFYNDAVNSEVDIIEDYARSVIFMKKRHAISAASRGPFVLQPRMLSELSFCDYPFVLDAGSKSRILQVDSDLEQRSRAQEAALAGPMMGVASQYLILRVRRENVIEDSLQQLVRLSADTLKKPLKVKFIGEEGVDEGGVQKEYFQILIRQLLDPAFGMFTYDEETRQLWFNSDSLESTMEFELIGILLGIAIYNAVILDVHFPHIVYKKLMECAMGLEDVEIAMPALGKGLRQLLEFAGNVEEVFQRNFEYSYEVFGAVKTVELKPGGSSIAVTNDNREEYVALYVDYLLNKSVERQYDAFHRGFHLVCNGEVLQMLRWEELHLIICGSPELDFEALEDVTHYDDGYTEDSECIRCV